MVTKATQMVYRKNAQWLFSLLALIIALPILLPANAFSAWNDITASVALSRTRPLYNYIDKVTYLNGSLTNTSGESFQAPIRLVIDSVTTPDVTVHNADGTTDDGKPYFDFSGHLGDETLDPGETSSAIQLDFYNPNRLRFNFSTKVLVGEEATVVLKSLSISPASVTLTSPSATRHLTITGTYSDGSTKDLTAANTGTVYDSSDPNVATVSTDGLITAGTSNGTAIITATNEGVSASMNVRVQIDITLSVVTITAPMDGATLTSAQVIVLGTVEDESPIQSALINGAPLTLDGINFSVQVDLVEGFNSITVTATDAYGNVGSASISVTYVIEAEDTTAPLVNITAPKDGVQLTQTPVLITGTVQDASPIKSLTLNGQPATLTDTFFALDLGLTEGANTITATATDEHDNIGSDSITVILDTTPPDLTVEPIPGLTNKTKVPVRGVSECGATIALIGGVSQVSGPTDQVSGEFSLSVELHQNMRNVLSVAASDPLGNTCPSKTLEINQDSTPPQVASVTPATGETVFSQNVPCRMTFSEPVMAETLALGTSFQVTCEGAAVNGSLTLSQDNQVATFMPDGAFSLGSRVDLLMTSAIKDLAGNQMAAPFISHFFTPQEIGASVVTGEVYDDTKGLLLSGAMAKLLSTNGVPLGDNAPSMVTGEDGLFTLEVSPGTQTILIFRDDCTSVERKIEVAGNVSAVLLDARLTPLDVKVNRVSGLAGGTAFNADGDIRVIFAEDSSSSDIELRITKVSPQGLRSPLPLGWSPAITVDLAANIDQLRNPATVTIPVPSDLTDTSSLAAVRWDRESSAWRVLSQSVQAGDTGRIELSINHMGQFSLVMADQGPTTSPTPKTEDILEGAVVVAYPAGISGQGILVPAVIMAGEDAHARASASLSLPEALPSGTVFEARVMETFTLRSSEEVVSQPFVQDLHFYGWPDDEDPLTLSVEFPVTPSKQYAFGELYLGKVDLYIRKPQTAATHMVGPAGALITTSEGLDISIAPDCLDRNTTLRALSVPGAQFPVPIPPGVTYLGGFNIDFGGVALLSPVEITLPPLSDVIILPPEPIIVMAMVEEVTEIPTLFLTGLGHIVGDRVQSLNETAGMTFSGIDRAGQYGFFLLADPIGFLQGTVYAVSGQPSTNAVISHEALPFLARVDQNGKYIQIGQIKALELIAKNPVTYDQGTATATIAAANEIVNADIAIQPTPPLVVSVTPADGSAAVSVTTSVSVSFSEPVLGVDADTFQLKDASGNTVTGHFSMTDEGKQATFYPDASLASESAYTLHLGDGIKDEAGYSLADFSLIAFTTEDLTPPVSQGELSLSMPDENGLATITGTPGTAEPNSVVYIINNTSGMVVTISMPSSTDGCFSEQILADISDEIIVTIVDAGGNSTTLNPGPFVDETTGAVVVGPKGGMVKGEGGIELDIPAGALPYAAVVKVEPVDEPFELPSDLLEDSEVVAAFEENYEFVQSVKIDTGGVKFNYGVDLSVPAPSGATPNNRFLVTRPLEMELGGELFDAECGELIEKIDVQIITRLEVADSASVQKIDGEWKLSTESPPFTGIITSGVYHIFQLANPILFGTQNEPLGIFNGSTQVVYIQGVVENYDGSRAAGAVLRLVGGPIPQPFVSVANENGFFTLTTPANEVIAYKTSFIFDVQDPFTGAIGYRQERTIAAGNTIRFHTPVALTRPLIIPHQSTLIRKDVVPPTVRIDITVSSFRNNIVEVGDDVTVSLSVSDNRTDRQTLWANSRFTLNGRAISSPHVISNIISGIYRIEAEVKDEAGNVETAERIISARDLGIEPQPQAGPPVVLSTYPADQTVNVVPVGPEVILILNESVDLTNATASITDLFISEVLQGKLSLIENDTVIIFRPVRNLRFGTAYKFQLSGVVDSEGYSINKTIHFTTVDQPVVLGKYLISDSKALELIYPYALITDANRADISGLTIVDVSKPTNIQKVSNIALRNDLYSSLSMALDRSNALIITTGKVYAETLTLLSTLELVNASDPQNPKNVSNINLTEKTSIEGATPYRIAVHEDYAFIAWLNFGLQIIDIKGDQPQIIGAIRVPGTGVGRASDVDILGNYAYIANGPVGELLVIQYVDPQTEEIGGLSFIDNDNNFIDDRIVGRLNLPGPGRAWRLKVIDDFEFSDSWGNVEHKNIAIVSRYNHGLDIVDIGEPTNPLLIGHLDESQIQGTIYNLSVDKSTGLLFLATGSSGIKIIDINDPSDPKIIGSISASFITNAKGEIEYKNGYIYALTETGLHIITVSGLDQAVGTLKFIPEQADDTHLNYYFSIAPTPPNTFSWLVLKINYINALGEEFEISLPAGIGDNLFIPPQYAGFSSVDPFVNDTMAAYVQTHLKDYLKFLEEANKIIDEAEILPDTLKQFIVGEVTSVIKELIDYDKLLLLCGPIGNVTYLTKKFYSAVQDLNRRVQTLVALFYYHQIEQVIGDLMSSIELFSQKIQDESSTLVELRRKVFFPTHVTLSGIIDDGGQATAISSNVTIDTVREERAAFIFAAP